MARLPVFALLHLLGALVSGSLAQSMTSCPTAETIVQDSSGAAWAVCPNADYQGQSSQVAQNVASDTACANYCLSVSGCSKAVYDKVNRSCHVKGDPNNVVWAQNNQFDTLRPYSGPMTSCPTAETIVQDSSGAAWAVCPNADYQGWSSQIAQNIASDTACANYCLSVSGCSKAVYDKVNRSCHVKGDPNNVVWAQNNQFDTLRPYTGPISTCPTTESQVQDSNGRTWAVCPNTDYQGTTATYVANIQSDAACVAQCSAVSGCSKAVFDKGAKGCHLKSGSLTWATNTKYDSMRLISNAGGQSTSCANGQTLTTSDGSQFGYCPGLDWVGTSIYVLNNYASAQACAEACALTPVCQNAIFDSTSNVCHIKAAPNQLQQATNARYNQINLIKKAAPVKQAVAVGGSWSGVISLPVVPGAAYLVPQQPQASRLLVFSANADMSWGSRTGLTQFADYNYVTGAVSQMTVSNTHHDMFCPGISALESGKVVVTGGSDANLTSIYDPSTNTFSSGPNMQLARGYQSSTILSNGKVFTIGGSWSGGNFQKNGEVYDPASNSWTLLNGDDASTINTADPSAYRQDNHAWLHPWTDGSVFHAGPSKQMHWFRTSGSGSVTSAGTRNSTNDAMCAINVMYDAGKILAAGGTLIYDDSPGQSTSYLISISTVGQAATVVKTADMKYSRAFANSVVLPDGTVMVLGGQKRSRQFTDIESTIYPELFNPVSKTWKVLNPQAIPRNYHSSALLLGDGTVFSGGGGLCYVTDGNDNDWACDPSANHANAEIFSPPYLFNSDGSQATRPTINSLSTSTDNNGNWVRAGGTLSVTMNDNSGTTFSLIRVGSSTHSVNTDQRRLSLTATQNGNAYSITLPTDSGVLLPGYWFLFAMNKAGVPSIARVVQVRL